MPRLRLTCSLSRAQRQHEIWHGWRFLHIVSTTIFLVLPILATCGVAYSDAAASVFRAGAAKSEPLPFRTEGTTAAVHLLQLPASKNRTTVIHDDPFARALVLDDGRTRVAIVAVDTLLFLGSQTVRQVEAIVASAGITHVFLVATHDHNASVSDVGGPDLVSTLANVILKATNNLEPASLGVPFPQTAREGFNRVSRRPLYPPLDPNYNPRLFFVTKFGLGRGGIEQYDQYGRETPDRTAPWGPIVGALFPEDYLPGKAGDATLIPDDMVPGFYITDLFNHPELNGPGFSGCYRAPEDREHPEKTENSIYWQYNSGRPKSLPSTRDLDWFEGDNCPRCNAYRKDHILDPIDDTVGIAFIQSADGNHNIATIVNFAATATIIGGQGNLISGEWPEMMMSDVEASLGGTTLFLQGAAGDVDPWLAEIGLPIWGHDLLHECDDFGITAMEQLGRRLADKVITARKNVEFTQPSHVIAKTFIDTNWRIDDEIKANCALRLQPSQAEISTLLIDDKLALAMFPGEFFTQYGLNLKTQSVLRNKTMFVGYTNDFIGYVPSDAAYFSGAATLPLHGAIGTVPQSWMCVPRGTGDRLVDEAIKMLGASHE